MVPPLVRIRRSPNDQQILNGGANVESLRNENNAGAGLAFKEPRQMPRDRLSIMRDQNSSGLGRNSQYGGICGANHTTVACVAEIDRWLSSSKARTIL